MNDVHDRSRQFVMVPYDIIEAISKPIDLAVWVCLKKYANKQGAAHPSRTTIADDLGLKDGKSIDAPLSRLKKMGLVDTFPRWRDEHGKVWYSPEGPARSRTTNGYVVFDVPRKTGPPYGESSPTPYGESSPTPYGESSPTPMEESPQELDPFELDPFELDIPHSPPEGDAAEPGPGSQKQSGSSSSRRKPKHRLAEDWTPRVDVRQQMAQECPTVDQDHELDQFRDYFIANDKTSTDWNLNYRRWIRTESKRARGRPGGAGVSKFDQIMQAGRGLHQHHEQREIS